MAQPSEMPRKPNALVMAASRRGDADSVAKLQNKSHKCLVEIDGVVMIERVIGALIESGRFKTVYVSIESGDILRAVPNVARWMDAGQVVAVESRGNLADSVLAAVDAMTDPLPLVITTGDNALHTPQLVADFADQFMAGSADVAIAFTERADILPEFPEPGLAFHEMKDGGFSSCNLYGLRNENALKTIRVFESGGQFGKRHMRILKAFGITPFLLYKLRLATCEGLIRRIGRNLGASMEVIMLPYAYGPIDVDNPASFALTEETLKRRRLKPPAARETADGSAARP